MNGGPDALEVAESAKETARAAYEAVGRVLREVHDLREEVRDGFVRLEHRFADGRPPPESEHPWGRRGYDPELTHPGSDHARVPVDTIRRMQRQIDEVLGRESEVSRREELAAAKMQGAADLQRVWKARILLGIAIGGPVLSALFELVKWLVVR